MIDMMANRKVLECANVMHMVFNRNSATRFRFVSFRNRFARIVLGGYGPLMNRGRETDRTHFDKQRILRL